MMRPTSGELPQAGISTELLAKGADAAWRKQAPVSLAGRGGRRDGAGALRVWHTEWSSTERGVHQRVEWVRWYCRSWVVQSCDI